MVRVCCCPEESSHPPTPCPMSPHGHVKGSVPGWLIQAIMGGHVLGHWLIMSRWCSGYCQSVVGELGSCRLASADLISSQTEELTNDNKKKKQEWKMWLVGGKKHLGKYFNCLLRFGAHHKRSICAPQSGVKGETQMVLRTKQ